MNLVKMFEMQKVLDEHIMVEHPELRGHDNLDWKILALQVELGECANEWRGFKKWSNDQQPRTLKSRRPYIDLEDADFYNPMLEEYVDCLHFILSIGLELEFKPIYVRSFKHKNTTKQFRELYWDISNLDKASSRDEYLFMFNRFVGLGEMLGFTWEQIETAYFEKNAINHQRQEIGY